MGMDERSVMGMEERSTMPSIRSTMRSSASTGPNPPPAAASSSQQSDPTAAYQDSAEALAALRAGMVPQFEVLGLANLLYLQRRIRDRVHNLTQGKNDSETLWNALQALDQPLHDEGSQFHDLMAMVTKYSGSNLPLSAGASGFPN